MLEGDKCYGKNKARREMDNTERVCRVVCLCGAVQRDFPKKMMFELSWRR